MAKSPHLLFGQPLRKVCTPWFERLGKPDSDQLKKLFDLSTAERTPLNQILAGLFPEKDEPKGLVALNSLRKRLNDASSGKDHDLPDLRLRFQTDSKKKHPTTERSCWFTGPDPTIEAASEMSRLSVQDVESISVINPQGIATTTGAMRKGKRTVRFFVSYSHEKDESRLVEDLLGRLRIEFGASPRYEIDFWLDRKIGVDKEWHGEIQRAIADCDFGLLMVCPAFLGSKYITEEELPHFVTSESLTAGERQGVSPPSNSSRTRRADAQPLARSVRPGVKPVIAVGLAKLDFKDQDLKGLEERQIYRLRKTGDPNGKFYSDLTSIKDKRDFVHELFLKMQQALDLRFGIAPTSVEPQESIEAAVPVQPLTPKRRAAESLVKDSHGHQQEFAREMYDQARLGRDPEEIKYFERPQATLGGQSMDALQYLGDWLAADTAPPILYVLGEFGIGKTTTLKQLALDLLERRATDPSLPLPLFVDLRHYLFDRKQHVPTSIHELLSAVIARNWRQPGPPTVTADDLLRLVRTERALLIFDGLDEKTVHMTPAEARAFIRVLWQALPEDSRRALGMRPEKTSTGIGRARLPPSRNSQLGEDVAVSTQRLGGSLALPTQLGGNLALPAQQTGSSEESADKPAPRTAGRLIISCRSHYFRDLEAETSMLTGEDREGIDQENTPVLTLLPFTEQQIRNYLTGLFDGNSERANGAFDLISSIHNLGELASRPYLLSLIAQRLEEFEEIRARGETVNAARLYQLFTQRWLNRDDGKHSLDPVHKRQLMEQLAAYLWRQGEKELDPDALERWLDRFLLDHPEIAGAYDGIERIVLKEDFRTACFVLREDHGSAEGDKVAQRDQRSAFRFAHTSLQEFFLAAWLWHGLKSETLDAFDLPQVSVETLDFLGQMLELEPDRQRTRALEQMSRILGGDCLRAATLAFRYWLRAIERGLPVPQPPFVNLAGANLDEWTIRGQSTGQPLNLRGARLTDVKLNRSRLKWVNLGNADLSNAELRQAVLHHVSAPNSTWVGADLSGLQWRRGSLIGANLQDARTRCELVHVELTGAKTSANWQARTHVPPSASEHRHGPVQFSGHGGRVSSCAWSPDGTSMLSASDDNTLKVWDAVSGECRLTLNGHTNWVSSCAWSPDGASLLSGSGDKTLKVWDAVSGECRLTLKGHTSSVSSCAWSPDGASLLSGSWDNTLKVWDAVSGEYRLTLNGHADGVSSCAWSPDGARLLSGSEDNTLKVWDAVSGEYRLTFNGHTRSVSSCAWSPDGASLLSGSRDDTLKVWDAVSGECRLTLNGHTNWVYSCAWSPDGASLLSASDDNTLKVWDAVSGEYRLTLNGHTRDVSSCAWSPDGASLLSASVDNTLKVWDGVSGDCRLTLNGHTRYVYSCAWSPDGASLLSGSRDNTLKVWDAVSGECRLTLNGHTNWVTSCAWSPDGASLLSASDDNTLKVWDAVSGECRLTLNGHTSHVSSCAWSPGGTSLLSASYDNTLKVWDAVSGECRLTLNGHTNWVYSCAWSPDGASLLSGSGDKTLKVWDAVSGECRLTLNGHTELVSSCAWSLDGASLLSGSRDKTLKVWDAVSGKCRLTLNGHTRIVSSCAWSPDGASLLSGSEDNTLKVWDAVSGECRFTLNGHTDSVTSCAWSPDGASLLSGSKDGTLKVWDAVSGECLQTAVTFPESGWATIDEQQHRVRLASPEAWRWLGWLIPDSTTHHLRRIPLESFGPIPGLD